MRSLQNKLIRSLRSLRNCKRLRALPRQSGRPRTGKEERVSGLKKGGGQKQVAEESWGGFRKGRGARGGPGGVPKGLSGIPNRGLESPLVRDLRWGGGGGGGWHHKIWQGGEGDRIRVCLFETLLGRKLRQVVNTA